MKSNTDIKKRDIKIEYIECPVIEDIHSIQKFWDAQAEYYADTELTRENEEELMNIGEKLNSISLDAFIGLGVADGSRDPLEIFLNLKNKFPKLIIVNDLSTELIIKACLNISGFYLNLEKTNTKYNEIRIIALRGAIHEIFTDRGIIEKVRNLLADLRVKFLLCIGVYKVDAFFKFGITSGFDLYNENVDKLGKDFKIKFIFWDNSKNSFCEDIEEIPDPIKFSLPVKIAIGREILKKIEEGVNTCSDIESKSKTLNFVGLRVEAVKDRYEEKKFISHYYKKGTLEKILRYVFSNDNYDLHSDIIPRGIVYYIQKKNDIRPTKGIITMLNNVLGSIDTKHQIQTLNAVKNVFL